jgi:uncharacterized membrane protein
MRETRVRSLIKTLTWQFLVLILTFLAALGFKIDFWTSTVLAVFANGCITLAYYIHERIWNDIEFGKKD